MGLFRKIFKGNTLYYRGCLTRAAVREIGTSYHILLKKAGIKFIEFGDREICCGSPALSGGFNKEAKETAERNFKLFKEHKIERIITPCPGCFRVFSQDYPKLVGGWDIKVEHATQALARALEKGKFTPAKSSRTVTYHDPCHLGRLGGVYEEPRILIKATGATLKEMKLSKDESFCCGGGAGVRSNYKTLSNSIADERVGMAKKAGAKIIVTCCPLCYLHLGKNSKGIEVKELSQFLRGE